MKYLALLVSIVLISCGGGSGNNESTSGQSESSSNNSSSSCLAEIADPAQWYSKSDIATLVGEEEENIRFKSNPDYDNCYFNWKNDRKHIMKVASNEIEVQTNNTIGITITNLDDKLIKAEKRHDRSFTYEEYFDTYHTTTKQGEEQVKEALEEKGKKDENAKKAKGLLDMAPTEGHTAVNGIGDKANMYIQTAPGLRETRLSILHGNVVVMINVDVSDEDEKDKEIAMTVAKNVLALCD